MSVINKMLLELEQRQSGTEMFGMVRGQIKAVPERRRISGKQWLMAGLLGAGAIAASVLYLREMDDNRLTLAASNAVSAPVLAKSSGAPTSGQPAQPQIAAAGVRADVKPKVNSDTVAVSFSPDASPVSRNDVSPTEPITKPTADFAREETRPVRADRGAARNAGTAQVAEPPVATAPRTNAPAQNQMSASVASTAAYKTAPAQREAPEVGKQIREFTPQQQAENEYRRASGLIHQGRLNEALAVLDRSLELDPQHWGALQAMVGVLVETKRADEAVRRLQSRLASDRSHIALAMMLARLQVSKGEVRGAIDTLHKSASYAAQRSDYQAFLAALYQREGLHREAIDQYMLALNQTPQNGLWWMGLGISLQAQNRTTEARDAYRQAKDSNVLSAELHDFVEQRLSQLR